MSNRLDAPIARAGTEGRLARAPRPVQWAVLVAASVVFATALQLSGLPAALLLGPMAAGILAGVNGATVRVPRPIYVFTQAVVGCLIAVSIKPEIIGSIMADWGLFLGVVLATLSASSTIGWLMSRWRVLPGTVAVWGSSPGAANAMVLMAEAFGADARLVAFMQYVRVVFVALAASLIARFWVDTTGVVRPPTVWFPPIDPVPFAQTLALAALGAVAGPRIRLPSGTMLLPLIVGVVLKGMGLIRIELPEWLLVLAYASLGWNIGLGFTRRVLAHAARALPQIIASIVVLISVCGGLAFVLTQALGVDPLTAYLSTSPGGMDSVAIIAASSHVDMSFVMALQTMRFAIVMLAGPPLARLVARRMAAAE